MTTRNTTHRKPDTTLDFTNTIDVTMPIVSGRKVLKEIGLPVVIQHLEPLIAQLPLHVLVSLSAGALQHGFDDEDLEQALRDAIAFQERPAHRCGCCFRWVDPPFLVLTMMGEGRVVFAAACPRCEKLIDNGRTTRQMQANLESLINDELGGGATG
jgi:hypothetical protein